MRTSGSSLQRQGLTALAIALVWYAVAEFNAWLFASFEYVQRAHWIFLPAALRPLIILLFGKLGAAGLVLGAYLTVYGTTEGEPLHEIVLSLVLGITPWLAVTYGKSLLAIPSSLAGLKASHIVLLCTLCASANALALNGFLWLAGQLEGGPIQILTVLVGDLLGATILLFLVSGALSLVLPRR